MKNATEENNKCCCRERISSGRSEPWLPLPASHEQQLDPASKSSTSTTVQLNNQREPHRQADLVALAVVVVVEFSRSGGDGGGRQASMLMTC